MATVDPTSFAWILISIPLGLLLGFLIYKILPKRNIWVIFLSLIGAFVGGFSGGGHIITPIWYLANPWSPFIMITCFAIFSLTVGSFGVRMR